MSGGTRADRIDAVVLAGGAGERLGGVSKAELDLAGERLLDRVLRAVTGCDRVVVLAPETVPVPPGVMRTLEDPPGGGPVAGVSAGLAALPGAAAPRAVLVLACDLPGAASAVPVLRERFAARAAGSVGVVAVDETGHRQSLVLLVERSALECALAAAPVRDRSMRSVLAGLPLTEVPLPPAALADIDTWDAHALWEELLRGA